MAKLSKSFSTAHNAREAMRSAVQKHCPHGVDSRWKRTGGAKCKTALKLLDKANKRMEREVKKMLKKGGR